MPRQVIILTLVITGCGTNATTTSNSPVAPSTVSYSPALTMQDLPVMLTTSVAGTFTQDIDHPAAGGPTVGTFQQNYWYDTEFASGANAPVLFYICGEAACGSSKLGVVADSARALGASIVTLEHRYYGTSKPFASETLANMQYLTIHNVLEDMAAFETWAKSNLPLSGPWIAVGGSYAGALAAYYRLVHPDLVIGAWASSAPVNVVLSFVGYDQNETNTLGSTCALLFNQVLAAAQTAYSDPTQCPTVATELIGDASYCQTDLTDFLWDIAYSAEVAAQYGTETSLCDALQQEQNNPMQGLAEFLNPPLAGDSGAATGPAATLSAIAANAGPIQFFPAMRAPALAMSAPALSDYSGQEWWYQVCTEVGFYEIANPDRNQSITPDGVTVDFYNNWCEGLANQVPNVTLTNATYYQPILSGQASNIFFVTGSNDPWSNLSFMDPNQVPAGDFGFNVQGGSHCQDLLNLTPMSILGVFQVHKMFYDLATGWLAAQ